MHKRLLVVSDTALYKSANNVLGFGAVVKELELLQHEFEEIVWIGTNRPDRKDTGALIKINAKNIKTILMPQMGGKSVSEVCKILLLYPYLFFFLLKHIYKADVIHTRLPSHPAFIAVLISFLFPRKIWWNKFAGSWIPDTLPFFYKVQRRLLLNAKHTKVAINGFWKHQPAHCLSFENPCLYEVDLKLGKKCSEHKIFTSPFTFVFIGRLDEKKGLDEIVEALNKTPSNSIKEIHFIGDSPEKQIYEQQCSFLGDKAVFHGFLSSDKVHQILGKADFLLLPSKSEGFPKVIAEAACYGVIPIVSDVGSITHYINNDNGFVWKKDNDETYAKIFQSALNTNPQQLKVKSDNVLIVSKMFTFENYKEKLKYIIQF